MQTEFEQASFALQPGQVRVPSLIPTHVLTIHFLLGVVCLNQSLYEVFFRHPLTLVQPNHRDTIRAPHHREVSKSYLACASIHLHVAPVGTFGTILPHAAVLLSHSGMQGFFLVFVANLHCSGWSKFDVAMEVAAEEVCYKGNMSRTHCQNVTQEARM